MVLFSVRFSLSIITEYHFLVNLTVLNFTESLDILLLFIPFSATRFAITEFMLIA